MQYPVGQIYTFSEIDNTITQAYFSIERSVNLLTVGAKRCDDICGRDNNMDGLFATTHSAGLYWTRRRLNSVDNSANVDVVTDT